MLHHLEDFYLMKLRQPLKMCVLPETPSTLSLYLLDRFDGFDFTQNKAKVSVVSVENKSSFLKKSH